MWEFIQAGAEGNCQLFGVNMFEYKWNHTGQKVEVSDPVYNQKRLLNIYTTYIEEELVTFAAGEFSNGVYGFYVNQ